MFLAKDTLQMASWCITEPFLTTSFKMAINRISTEKVALAESRELKPKICQGTKWWRQTSRLSSNNSNTTVLVSSDHKSHLVSGIRFLHHTSPHHHNVKKKIADPNLRISIEAPIRFATSAVPFGITDLISPQFGNILPPFLLQPRDSGATSSTVVLQLIFSKIPMASFCLGRWIGCWEKLCLVSRAGRHIPAWSADVCSRFYQLSLRKCSFRYFPMASKINHHLFWSGKTSTVSP